MDNNLTYVEKIQQHELELERREQSEQQAVLIAIASLIKTSDGKKIFKYLFKSLDVTGLPDLEMKDNKLHEYLGFLRAGQSIYNLTCAADPDAAALILSKLEREKHERTIEQQRIEHDAYASSDE